VPEWPLIEEPELLDRLAMDERRFAEFLRALIARVPARAYETAALDRALGYPWARPPGSYRLADGGVDLLADMGAAERERVLSRFTSGSSGRSPLLAIGSNAAPETLERKFAHFSEEEDRAVLALTGRLHDFDVGPSAHLALYGSMPATLLPSPGTAVCATVLWVTPAQFTQLAWSELNYRFGKLRTRFEVDEGGAHFDEVMVFVSRFGTFRVDKRPVALAAIEADGRTVEALTQERLLDDAAALALGPEAGAETLVRAIFEDTAAVAPKIAATVNRASLPFASERWTPFLASP
jgi:hypothetical protein